MAQNMKTELTGLEAELPLHRFVTYRVARVQAKLNAQATRLLREASGITLTQWRVIALIGAAGETQSSTLSKEAALDKGLLSRALKTLIEERVVQSTTDASDKRVQILRLTEKGRAIFEKTLPVTRKRQANLREGLTDEELRVFHKVLDHFEIAAEE